ncbi:MAG TPA: C25 family cysteine peptidase [Kiritimatiellia bacterium]|nr:C25 family cysteine peptidase [Kiritimatiellia bacterium]HSA18984.1 C25 family cysteine peptidase [Kiritimatiellia bacterium]
MTDSRSAVAAALLGLATTGLAGLLPPMTGAPGDFAQRRAGAEVAAVHRIPVTNEGLYRIDYPALVAAGFTNPVGNALRMYCQTQEVALYVSSPGALSASDYVLFYGWGHDGYYTITNVYWLGEGGSGLRMGVADAAPLAGGTEVTATWKQVRFNRDILFGRNTRPTDTNFDHWAYGQINTSSLLQATVSTDGRAPEGMAQLDAILVGVTAAAADPDHRTRVRVNARVATTNFTYDADGRYFGSCIFSNSWLSNGLTTVDFIQIPSGVPDDRAVLEEFTVGYTRLLAATGGVLSFAGRPGTNNFTVTRLASNESAWALDVTAPAAPVLLTNMAVSDVAGGRTIRFGAVTAGSNLYYVCSTSAVRGVTGIERVMFRNLADTNRQADFIAVCPYEFRDGTYRLLEHRYLTGLKVAVAPVSDIYNEFSYGIKDADAVKQFIGYAFHHWRAPEPGYVLFVGDGSYDPKNNKGVVTNFDWVPVHLGPSAYDWSAQDSWFAAVNGNDFLADVGLGRLPVSGATDLTGIVAKIVAYDGLAATNSWRKKALLVADANDGINDFDADSDSVVDPHLLSNGFSRTKAYRDSMTAPQVLGSITNSINGKVLLVSYFGHGAPDYWSADQFFVNADVNGLNNSVWPLFLMLTCRNGMFDDAAKYTISESLLRRPNRGAIACAAASGLSVPAAANYFADGFTASLVNTQQQARVGDLMNAGFLNLWTVSPNQPELLFYSIIGDPAQVVNP